MPPSIQCDRWYRFPPERADPYHRSSIDRDANEEGPPLGGPSTSASLSVSRILSRAFLLFLLDPTFCTLTWGNALSPVLYVYTHFCSFSYLARNGCGTRKSNQAPHPEEGRGLLLSAKRVDGPCVEMKGPSQRASFNICTKPAGVTTGGSCSGHSRRSLSPDTITSALCSRAR